MNDLLSLYPPTSQRSLGKDSLRMSAEGKFYVSYEGLGFPDNSAGKESTCNAGDPGSIPGLGRFTGEGENATHSQFSGLENSMDCI